VAVEPGDGSHSTGASEVGPTGPGLLAQTGNPPPTGRASKASDEDKKYGLLTRGAANDTKQSGADSCLRRHDGKAHRVLQRGRGCKSQTTCMKDVRLADGTSLESNNKLVLIYQPNSHVLEALHNGHTMQRVEVWFVSDHTTLPESLSRLLSLKFGCGNGIPEVVVWNRTGLTMRSLQCLPVLHVHLSLQGGCRSMCRYISSFVVAFSLALTLLSFAAACCSQHHWAVTAEGRAVTAPADAL